MKTKWFLSALLCAALMLTLLPAESVRAADNTFTYGGVTITGDITTDDIKYSKKHITLGTYIGRETFHITLSGTAEAGVFISLEGGNTAYITLDNLHMTGSIALGNSSHAYFYLKGSNSLTEGGLSISLGATAEINQAPMGPGETEEEVKGFLYATGKKGYPGILVTSSFHEGSYYKGTLTIRGGTITAIGGYQAAGIGGSDLASGGRINIHGGVVTAIGKRGAGIGGGNASGNGGEIYIYGGIVNAYSTEAGAGIGGGDDDSDGGEIYIAGGFINAVGAGHAAGIGGGNNGTSGNITITGGTVVATGGSGGAGIGGGKRNNEDGGNVDTIRLYGSAIFACGKDGGEDIGKGAGGTSGGRILIDDIPATFTGIPTAVFLRNNTPAASGFTNIASGYSRVGPEDYAGISDYGIELSTLFPSSPPPITSTLPAGVTPPDANWLENFWAGQRNLWSSATGIGAYLQLRSIHYYNTRQGPGDIVQSQHKGTTGKVLDGSIVSLTGYTFVTWKTPAGKAYNPGTDYTFNDSLDLDATWSPVVYDIGYNLAGGTVSPPNPTSYTIETPDFTLTNPTKAGYTFAGWSGTGITGDPVMNVTIPKKSTGERYYTANWTPNTYTVHYDANGGAGTMADTIHTYDLAAPLRENTFTYSGHSFVGWATDPNGDVVYLDKQSVTNLAQSGVVNLYAKWALAPLVSATISPEAVTFDLDSTGDVSTTISWGSATTVNDVVYGSDHLESPSEYTVSGNTLSIKQAYLSGLNPTTGDALEFLIAFDAGDNARLTVNIVDSYVPSSDASLSDLGVAGVTVPGFVYSQHEYTVELPCGTQPGDAATVVTATPNDLRASVIITQATTLPGNATVRITAEDGITSLIYTINFTLATPRNATISPDTATFDKNPINQADVITTITWNDATSVAEIKKDGISIGAAVYTVSGDTLTIKKKYLATQPTGSLALTVEFDKGNAAALTINISDTTPPAPAPSYTLTTTVDPAGSGTVELNPAGNTYPAGTTVTLTANLSAGYAFDYWSGDLSGSTNPATITIDANKNVTAHFVVAPAQPDLTVTNINTPDSITAGSAVTVTATVANTGAAGASNFDVTLYAGADPVETQNVASLSAGANTNVNFTWTPAAAGEVTLKAVADSGNAIVESNETNNELTKTVTVKPVKPEPCFIATAAYGSYLDHHVQTLREFRNDVLMKFSLGRALVSLYYNISPPLADFIAQYDTLKTVTRVILTPMVYSVAYPKISGIILLLLLAGSALLIFRIRKKTVVKI